MEQDTDSPNIIIERIKYPHLLIRINNDFPQLPASELEIRRIATASALRRRVRSTSIRNGHAT